MDDQQQTPTEPEAFLEDTAPDESAAESEATGPNDELSKAKAVAEENMAGWKRATADYANLKKENERDRAEMARYAATSLVATLLPVFDSFKKAAEARPTDTDAQKMAQWADGIAFIRLQFESAMKSAGVSVIDEAGVPFDAMRHEAMLMEKGDKDTPPGTVVRVLEPGYRLYERVVRPAKVVVSE